MALNDILISNYYLQNFAPGTNGHVCRSFHQPRYATAWSLYICNGNSLNQWFATTVLRTACGSQAQFVRSSAVFR